MMKLFIIATLVGIALARPQGPGNQNIQNNQNNQAQILRYENDFSGFGNYHWLIEGSDGTFREEIGEVQNEGTENEYLRIRGQYSWIAPDGVKYSVGYFSDDQGYTARGAHIPPAASVESEPNLGIPSAALGSLVGGGLGR